MVTERTVTPFPCPCNKLKTNKKGTGFEVRASHSLNVPANSASGIENRSPIEYSFAQISEANSSSADTRKAIQKRSPTASPGALLHRCSETRPFSQREAAVRRRRRTVPKKEGAVASADPPEPARLRGGQAQEEPVGLCAACSETVQAHTAAREKWRGGGTRRMIKTPGNLLGGIKPRVQATS